MRSAGYLYIAGTVLFTVYGQLVFKWRVERLGDFPSGLREKLGYLADALLDPFIISGLASAVIASLFWIAAISKFDLSYAYPFMSLSFVLVVLFSVLLFSEPLTLQKTLGLVLIVSGVIIAGRSF